MQKTIEKKQTWMNGARNNGIVIGNAQIGSSSETVIGNAVIGGITVGTPDAADIAATSGAVLKTQVLGNAGVSTGIVGNAVIETPNWKNK